MKTSPRQEIAEVSLFTRRSEMAVQGFIIKLLNNNCSELDALVEGPRLDRRVNLTIVAVVIPVRDGETQLREAFTAVTKEFSATGVGLVLHEQRELDDVVLGFRWLGEMRFVRARLKHFRPMGGGFYHAGLHLTELLHVGDYPELEHVFA